MAQAPAPSPARSIDPLDYQSLPRPVAAMAKEFADGHHIAPHSHKRAQLIFAARGVMTIATGHGAWVVPPQRALWMPAGMVHEIRMAGAVSMRTLYVDPRARGGRLPATIRVIAVSALLRELVLRACALPVLYDEAASGGHVMALILEEIAALPSLALDLPMPRDARLQAMCRRLRADPGDARTLDDWAREAGASARTLARLFQRETTLSFADWRQQARLLAAMARLAEGQAITRIALDLGYESPSAFAAMFKRALGTPPSRYFRAGPAGAAASIDGLDRTLPS
ncbi:helix-turn-helix transcriptional regulator [Vineibacter terrae]|uniref:AraC family transcriptional regulator n=1 Tax=Vineibacter terrae TaxID=2586908 RepID=UPI002E2F720E|nr:helix-turn-helix transcriptional regulator [Vineibacter terrae]HEX2891148.1 helix-turn-helix transcriptional regulator [Vineibacter terrae]